jgi:hypothetical protein
VLRHLVQADGGQERGQAVPGQRAASDPERLRARPGAYPTKHIFLQFYTYL